MSEENALMTAHEQGTQNTPAPVEVESDVSISRRREPEQIQSANETSETPSRSLADEEDQARETAAEQERGEQWARQNVAELAEELGCDAADLRLPKSIAGYDAALIVKVMGYYDLGADDLRSPAKVQTLKTAIDAELAEQAELDEVRKSLSEEEEPDPEEDLEETDEPAEEEAEAEEEQKPPVEERPSSLAEMTPEAREAMQKHVNEVYQRSTETNEANFVGIAQVRGIRGSLGLQDGNTEEKRAEALGGCQKGHAGTHKGSLQGGWTLPVVIGEQAGVRDELRRQVWEERDIRNPYV